MKKLSILLIAILFCSLQGHAQFWISFGWNEPHCQNCLWMEQAIRMTNLGQPKSIIRSFIGTERRSSVKHASIIAIGISLPGRYISCVWNGTGNYSVSFRLRSFVCMCVSSVRHRHASMTGEVGTIIRIIRTTVRPMRAIVMKIIIGIANGNIQTIDGLTVSTTANGIPVNMIVLNHIITMAVHIMTMGSGSPANTIVRAIREAVPVPIITRISTIRTNLTRNVRIGIKTGITIGTNGLTRIARIAANVRVTGGA